MSTDGKLLAIIGATYMAAIIADKAREMGIKTICFAWEEGAVAKNHVDVFYPISVMEKDRILNICSSLSIDGVICATEAPIETCGYLASSLGLNGNSIETSKNITNKYWVRMKTKECNYLKHPEYLCLENKFDLAVAEQWNVFPAIVKPVCGGGKKGVVVADTAQELIKAISYAGSFDRYKKGLMVESYISEGKEYSVETLSYKGNHKIIQITEKISSGPPHCVELGHHQPASIPLMMKTKVVNALIELLDAVGLLNGPAHTEIKINRDEIFLIELNARFGGDHIASKLTMLSTGYDYIAESIRVALNQAPHDLPKNYNRYSGVYFVTKQTEFLYPIFVNCDSEDWLYEKHVESETLSELLQNDCLHANYMIYCSERRVELL